MPAAERRAVQVDRRAEDDVDALADRLAGEHLSRSDAAGPRPTMAAIAEPDGKRGRRLELGVVPPRTPTGPSDTVMTRSPISGTACVVQAPAPESSRILVSRSSLSDQRVEVDVGTWTPARGHAAPGEDGVGADHRAGTARRGGRR